MSDRRVKEREKVWGRRPVILRFDSGHPRPVLEDKPDQRQEETTSALIASFLSSVISTGMLPESSPESPKPRKKWFLVDAEGPAQRRPIEFQEEETPATGPVESDDSVATQAPPKTRARAFWRLQTPHISLNVFPPKTTT